MKKAIFIALITGIVAAGFAQDAGMFRQEGIASWYGPEFDGKPTASGEIFDSTQFTAAHPSLPFNTLLRVTNKDNNKTVTVRINDRGPFVAARIVDVSQAAAEALDMLTTGTAPVIIEVTEYAAAAPQSASQENYSYYDYMPPAAAVEQAPAIQPQIVQTQPAQTQPAVQYTQIPQTQPAQSQPPVQYAPAPQTQPAQTQPGVQYAPAPQTQPAQSQPSVHQYAPAPQTQPVQSQPSVQYAPVPQTQPVTSAPVYTQASIIGGFPPVGTGKSYRLQIGAYKVPRNAVDTFDKLKSVGLNPAYERYGDLYRVVLAGLRPEEIPEISRKLGLAGFREVLLRQEY